MLDGRISTFVAVVESGSFTKASQALFLSSVSVKKQIDSLERSVGVGLLVRTNHGVSPTAAGQELYRSAVKLSVLAEEALARVRGLGEGERATVRIGTSLLRPCRRILDLWSAAGGDALPISIAIVPFDDESTHVNEMVASLGNRIDCFAAPCDSIRWSETCEVIVLSDLPLRLAVPRTHRLARCELVTWDDLDGETLMVPVSADFPTVSRLVRDLREDHPRIRIASSPTHMEMTAFNLCAQSGHPLITYDIWSDVHPAFVTLPVAWDYTAPYGIVCASDPSPATQEFVRIVEGALASRRSARSSGRV